MNPHSTHEFSVSESKKGAGIRLEFVNPVIKKTKKDSFNLNNPVTVAWEPYDGASKYIIQIYEKTSPHQYQGNTTLFPWSDRPEVNGTSLDVKSYTQALKPGYYYVFEVLAMSDKGLQISESARIYQSYDFKVE